MLYYPVKVPSMSFTILLDCSSAHCEQSISGQIHFCLLMSSVYAQVQCADENSVDNLNCFNLASNVRKY